MQLFSNPRSGVFITKGDVGVGTIVGSAVFNILVIIGLSGIFAGQVEENPSATSVTCCREKEQKHFDFLSADCHPDVVVPLQRLLLLHPVCAGAHPGEMKLLMKRMTSFVLTTF